MGPLLLLVALLVSAGQLQILSAARSLSGSSIRAAAGRCSDWSDKLPEECDVDLSRGPTRDMFPENFTFGVATSAFQVEGATTTDGRGPSIWDTYVATPGKVADGSNADIADASYYNYKDDIRLMQAMGVQYYRFSISWTRILPFGKGEVNQLGVDHYSSLIDALLAAGIQPVITLYHWDLPQALETQYGGWLSRLAIDDFLEYADVCFRAFGDRVQKWITINEPDWCAHGGYAMAVAAPGRCSDRMLCKAGDSATEPYVVGHNMLLAHAAVVALYRAKYKGQHGGQIGLTVTPAFYYPATETPQDYAAAQTIQEFFDAIVFGDYPPVMREQVGARLPSFTPEERQLVLGSSDFYGLNFYTAYFASPAPPPAAGMETPFLDRWVTSSQVAPNGTRIGPHRYPGLPIEVHENGVSEKNDPTLALDASLCDKQRLEYYQDYVAWVAQAVKDGANVRSYYAWSLLDNFEWSAGYTERFGIHFVNFSDPARKAHQKASAIWWSAFLHDETSSVALS
eukprot:jgi/Mesen1/2859/ME000174S02110